MDGRLAFAPHFAKPRDISRQDRPFGQRHFRLMRLTSPELFRRDRVAGFRRARLAIRPRAIRGWALRASRSRSSRGSRHPAHSRGRSPRILVRLRSTMRCPLICGNMPLSPAAGRQKGPNSRPCFSPPRRRWLRTPTRCHSHNSFYAGLRASTLMQIKPFGIRSTPGRPWRTDTCAIRGIAAENAPGRMGGGAQRLRRAGGKCYGLTSPLRLCGGLRV